MVTAAAGSDAAVVLVDATKLDWRARPMVLLPQTRRRALLARLLRVPSIVFAVNKLDAVDDPGAAFAAVREALAAFAAEAGIQTVAIVPVSALRGDMVVERGDALGWYDGPTLLEYLETVPARHDESDQPLRFPVQRVARVAGGNAQPGSGFEGREFRGYQGTIASGHVAVVDEVLVSAGRRASSGVRDHYRRWAARQRGGRHGGDGVLGYMLQIMQAFASRLDVPEAHLKDHSAWPSLETATTAESPQKNVRIHSGKEKPAAAFAAVRYRDYWFWVDNGDLQTKRALTVVMFFFTLAETGDTGKLPLITIPAQ